MNRKRNTDAIENSPSPQAPPAATMLLKEARAVFDVASMPLQLATSWTRRKKASADMALPVIMFPGFASDQRYMKPLEAYLRNLGYNTEDWGLGLNMAGMNLPHTLEDISQGWQVEVYDGYTSDAYRGEGGVPYLCDRATEQVRRRSEQLGSAVTLIGWSLGGYVAREVARDLPHDVAHVITLGSPIVGGPKYTRAANLFRQKGFDLDWIESETVKRDATPIQQPITAIFSKSDGVVSWPAAIDKVSPRVTHIEVDAPHLGMGFNAKIWRLIEQSLRRYGQSVD